MPTENEPQTTEKTTDTDTPGEGQPTVEQLQQQLRATQENLQKETVAKGQAQRYIAAMVAKMEEKAAEVDSAGNKTTEADRADQFLEIFRDNPQAALDAHFNARMRPIFTEHLANQEVLYKERAKDKIGAEDWNHYEGEIEEYMAQFDPSIRAKPGAWENAYKIIVAGHLPEEVERQTKKKVKMEQEAALEGSSSSSSRAGKAVPLSDLEKQVAKGLGLSEQEYKKNKESQDWGTPMR